MMARLCLCDYGIWIYKIYKGSAGIFSRKGERYITFGPRY